MKNFTDIKSHIIPEFDDGPFDIDESLEILILAEKSGVSKIIATPHYENLLLNNKNYKDVEEYVEKLNTLVHKHDIDINIFSGMTLNFTEKIIDIIDTESQSFSLNKTRFFLIESTFNYFDENNLRIIEKFRDKRLYPIISHPERNNYLRKNYKILEEIINLGALIQINSDSIIGNHGEISRRFALDIIEKKHATCISSEIHNKDKIMSPNLDQSYEIISKLFGENVSNKLFISNPQLILDGHLPKFED
tara:strand:- start:3226 stop:3972 length:747 start_codon:yes stop_codon:yes gene_type:complete